jgi:hypothetical protein
LIAGLGPDVKKRGVPGRIISTTRQENFVSSSRKNALASVRRASEPWMHTWEYNNIDITEEMYLEGIGNVSRYLRKQWNKKKKKNQREEKQKEKAH